MTTWIDRVYDGARRYVIKTDAGSTLYDKVQIDVTPTPTVLGTDITAARLNAMENPDLMTQSEAETGTAVTERVINAAVMKAAVEEHSILPALLHNKTWVGNASDIATEIDLIPNQTAWTPTLTGITIGSGTVTAYYVRVGAFISARVSILFSGTSVTGTVGISTPTNIAGVFGQPVGSCIIRDVSAGKQYLATPFRGALARADIRVNKVATTYVEQVNLSSSVPMTWANGDYLIIELWYIAS